MTRTIPFGTLARALSAGVRTPDLLPELHRELLVATGGTRSVVLERVGLSDDYVASSGRGFGALGGTWAGADEALALADAIANGPVLSDLDRLPRLAHHLATDRALLIPVPSPHRQIVVAVASPALEGTPAFDVAARAAAEFGVALEWTRLARDGSFHHRLRELSLVFSRGLTSPVTLTAALEALVHEANTLLGTSRTSIWLHDRRARELAVAASTHADHAASAARVASDDVDALASRGLRLERAQVMVDSAGVRAVVAPLRGWRRALGTLVIEGPPTSDLSRDQLVDLVHELARLLSAGIENVQLLEEVLRQRRLLEDTFNSLVDLVIVTDQALRVVQMNEAFAARLVRPRTEVFERGLAEFVGAEMWQWVSMPDAGDPVGDAEGGRSPGSQVRTRTFVDPRLGGTFATTMTPLVNEDGAVVGRVLVARDVTLQTRLEAEREALRHRLAQSEKLASLGQFVAGIAHEMNNPLQGVLGHLELLIETDRNARPLRRELRRIYQEADRAAKIVHNLLVFAGSRRMARRRLRIDRVVSRALASRRASLSRLGISVVRQQADALPPVAGDPLLLQQAFLNILMNAEHAIAESGRSGIIEIASSVDTRSGRVAVTIRDNANGIAPEALPRIFDPFFTTKEVGKGTGLGLAITYGIVQEHGGTITAANAPGGGAVFRIEFPATA